MLFILSLLALLPTVPAPASPGAAIGAEARVSLDLKDAEVTEIVRVLAGAADLQVVFDPGIACRLTLKLRRAPWQVALDSTLRACALAQEGQGRVLRVAPAARLVEEADADRRLEEARADAAPRQVTAIRLSYARASEMAPILRRLLSPRGDVVFDARTNTLLVVE